MAKMIICKECGETKEHGGHGLCERCAGNKWNRENKDKVAISARKYHFMSKYGITVEQYDEMLEDQGGACAICGKTAEESDRRLSIDHCHTSGKIRGILCQDCNLMLGSAKDNVNTLIRAAEYLCGPTIHTEELYVHDDIVICERRTIPSYIPEMCNIEDEDGEEIQDIQDRAHVDWIVGENELSLEEVLEKYDLTTDQYDIITTDNLKMLAEHLSMNYNTAKTKRRRLSKKLGISYEAIHKRKQRLLKRLRAQIKNKM